MSILGFRFFKKKSMTPPIRKNFAGMRASPRPGWLNQKGIALLIGME